MARDHWATEEKEGSKKRVCKDCGYEDFGSIDKLQHVHRYEEAWSKDERGHWHAPTCGDVLEEDLEILNHNYGDWSVTLKPTYLEKGKQERYCLTCNFKVEEEVPEVEYFCIINCIDWEGNEKAIYVDMTGEYSLDAPLNRIGYDFVTYVDENNKEFDLNGILSSRKDINLYEVWEIAETTTFEELKYRIENNVSEIFLNANIDFKDTIYISSSLRLYSKKEVHLIRNENFKGDMFVLGETENGQNSILSEGLIEVTFIGEDDGKIVLDGNSENVSALGTIIFIANSAVFNMTENVEIMNCKKLGNDRLLHNTYSFSYPSQVGGAAVIISYGTFNMYGGKIDNCSVKTSNDTIDNELSYDGGAIYSYGQVNMYSGVISNCWATRGGAILITA